MQTFTSPLKKINKVKPFLQSAFTLIELSIVLVIIGLIVGGILAGRELIVAAGVRAQITQIEKFNTAANTFYGKYGYLPGDIKDPDASGFGFAPRGTYAGEGDGNGLLEGVPANLAGRNSGAYQEIGETVMFWEDLSTAHMIDSTFSVATSTAAPSISTSSALYPAAVIGNGNFINIYSINPNTGYGWWCGGGWCQPGPNYFQISVVTPLTATSISAQAGLTVGQAYAIDKKIDDGTPFAGRVETLMNVGGNGSNVPAGNGGSGGINGQAIPASATSCYDNANGANGTAWQNATYSMGYNGGAGVNCVLSIKMQAGDQ